MTQIIDSKTIVSIPEEDWTWLRMSQQLGDITTKNENMIIFKKDQFKLETQTYSQQSQKLFEEIIQNSIDNFTKNKSEKYQIKVQAEERQFSVQNNGAVLAVCGDHEKNEDIKRIFSVQRTSDQFDKSNQEIAGQNGLGAKLVNQCSKTFQVSILQNDFKYVCTWKDCKQKVTSKTIEIKPDKKQENYCRVVVELADLNTQIELKSVKKTLSLNFCDFNVKLIQKYMIDLQLAFPEIEFILNDEPIPKFDLKEFLELNNIQNYKIQKFKNLQLQLIVFQDTPECLFRRYSLLNGLQIFNSQGKQYDCVQDQLKENCKVGSQISVGMFFLGKYPGLQFGEQIKDKVMTKLEIELNKEIISFVESLDENKNIKRDTKFKFIQKLTEANNVRSKKSSCTLIVTEGDSAACLFKQIQTTQHDFFDNFGLIPLRGKVLSVKKMGENVFDVINKEIKNLIQIIGLKKITYDEQSLQTLRYQHILIGTDYDVDGYHICGLIISFIHKYWPELIELGFFQRFTTPIIIGTDSKTKEEIEFFSESSFQKYPEKLKNVQYFKGLGSFNEFQTKQIGKNFQKYIKPIVIGSDDFGTLIQQLFVQKPEARKSLIKQYEEKEIDFSLKTVQVEECMQQVLEYSVETLQRAIPDFMDGLKESQRKIIYWMMKNKPFLLKGGVSQNKIKVSQLAGKVSGDLEYHHGETSLQESAALLAQNFTGTNNCNLLQPDGAFGNRQDPKSRGAPRYVVVSCSEWTQKLFSKEDDLLFDFKLSDDDKPLEPKHLFPIVPIQMLNGAEGIATGWSTFMPCYKLEDIIAFIIQFLNKSQKIQDQKIQDQKIQDQKIQDQKHQAKDQEIQDPEESEQEKFIKLEPFYNDYTGTLTMSTNEEGDQIMECEGDFVYKPLDDETGDLTIFDTVIGSSLSQLENYLKDEDNKIEFTKNKGILIKRISNAKLGKISSKFLVSSEKLCNMTFMDGTKVRQFKHINKFLTKWIEKRLKIYEKRRQAVMIQFVQEYMIQFNLTRLIQEDNLKLMDRKTYQDQLDKKLIYFTPFSKIQDQKETDLDLIIRQLKLDSKIQQFQPEDFKMSEYDYITEKTMKFYYNYDVTKLEKTYQQYQNYKKLSAKDIWIQELNQILPLQSSK